MAAYAFLAGAPVTTRRGVRAAARTAAPTAAALRNIGAREQGRAQPPPALNVAPTAC
jgi:hypothetical protein